MESTTSSHEVLVCGTCGDKGFTNAFIYCVKCLGFVIHRYCLKVITFDEIVNWVCEDCQQPLPLPHPSTSHKLNQKQDATISPPQVKPKIRKKKRSNRRKKKTKIPRVLETKDDVIILEESQHVSPSKKGPVLALEAPSKGDNKRKRDESFSDVKVNENKSQKMGYSVEESCCDSSCTDVNLKNKVGIQEQEATSPEKLVIDATESTCLENNNNNNVEIEVEIPDEPARPVQDPVWRGSFDITQTDYNLFEGFVGHLSTKACDKVCDEANVLPSLLSLEMHPKAVLWPKSFLESQPSDDNIALYFFPGDTQNERDYEELVSDMIEEDLAMTAPTKNAELLIFTSRVLPRSFWRFQGKNYLWGVFRGKKNPNPNPNPVLSENITSEVTSGKEILTKVKTFDSQSPQSPLCNYR